MEIVNGQFFVFTSEFSKGDSLGDTVNGRLELVQVLSTEGAEFVRGFVPSANLLLPGQLVTTNEVSDAYVDGLLTTILVKNSDTWHNGYSAMEEFARVSPSDAKMYRVSDSGSLLKSYQLVHGDTGSGVLIGSNSGDALFGLEQNDKLLGRKGSDFLAGGKGKDTLVGGNGKDELQGQRGADLLKGGAADDRLDGGKGADVLIGGRGGDTFIFSKSGGNDVVRDFEDGVDMVEIGKGATKFKQLVLSQNGDHAEMSFKSVTVTFLDTDVGAFSSADFMFV